MSVRQHHSTLCVTLRDASASLTQVTEIAGQFEQVRHDHATGEILCEGYVVAHITTVELSRFAAAPSEPLLS